MRSPVKSAIGGVTAVALAIGGVALGAIPAVAAVSPTAPVIINEVYGGGGNSGATLKQDFIELYNPGPAAVSLAGWSLQYASATGTGAPQVTELSKSIPAGGHFLVGQAFGTGGTVDLPTADILGAIPMGAGGGKVALVNTTTVLTCMTASGSTCATDASVIDFVGFGNANAFAGSGAAPAPSATNSVSRSATHANTANNAADFTAGAPTPTNSGAAPEPTPSPTPTESPSPTPSPTETTPSNTRTIAEIQGTGTASPLHNTVVTTTGVVTAAYPIGNFNGFVIQTAGTGGVIDLATHTASDAIFVYGGGSYVPPVAIGDHVSVTGLVADFSGLTQIDLRTGGVVTKLATPASVAPAQVAWPTTDAQRETLESMLIAPQGDFTVSNTYSTNQYGEVGLAAGTAPLIQPTEIADAGSAAYAAAVADNAAKAVVLDDGATTNFLTAANQSQTPPYVSTSEPVRVGAAVTFAQPVIVDWRNGVWKFNPTAQYVAGGSAPATFEKTRAAAPEAVGGDISIASFNVLNYFTTLGSEFGGCSRYSDRFGNGVTVNSCPGTGPRGAWDAADLAQQQKKIVAAINALDADVVGLLEIENSAAVDGEADEALSTLVDALNAAAGSTKWAFVPSSDELPAVSEQDAITNALIYQPAAVARVGASRALGTESDGGAFDNAREPIGQAFAPVAGGDSVFVSVNHFKSKGSAGPLPGDVDQNDGQGASNASRVAQAEALSEWIDEITAVGDAVALVGDFNAYTQEDPMQVLYADGYVDAASEFAAGEYSYSFSGLSGSLDHVLLNAAALERATGGDIWEINAEESIALEYSRENYHGTNFYAEGPYRSSDHNPVIVGLTAGDVAPTQPLDLTFLNINDFHGRIDSNTVKFAGTVEQERAAATGPVAFLSAGDNIGASLFASATQQDQPTIDVLNALDLAVSAVGNHEFDQGFADLTGRVTTESDFDYLGANVYLKGTTTPALDEYELIEMGGVTVAVIGVVTEETPTLVSPGGITTIDFGNPVDAVNRVAAQLTDGDPANGEADVIIAEYHDGAGAGTPDGSTLAQEIAAGGPFAELVTETSAAVDAIFTGHTHKQYAWEGPVPGEAGKTRPIVQTGSYGEFIGKVVLTYDPVADEVTAHTQANIARSTTADATLISTYPRVAEVDTIVVAALAHAAEVGGVPVGSVTGDITTAYSGGSYVGGVYTGSGPLASTGRDDRAKESTLGNLVADSLLATLSSAERGGAQIGVVNPGGLRNELYYSPDGVVTYAEANAVLPFVNNLWTTTLTGAQVETMLEQQWQRLANGTVPSRPYQQLGLSDNVTYTFDESRAEGDRITSITVDGEPIDPAAEYRIGTFSFLVTGGDNFHVFKDGTGARDSGLIDRDAWIAYLQANPGITPDFARQAVRATDLPTTVVAGESVEFSVAGLDLTSLGSPLNTGVDVKLDGVSIGTATVTAGAATVNVTVPAGTAAGDHVLTVVAAPSGTTVTLPLTVTEPAPPAYDAGAVYTGGQYVTYQGKVYYAQWWASGQTPGTSPYGAWAEVGAEVVTPRGTFLTWTNSWTYTGGETVVYNGQLWKAKWWTRNQAPGDPWGPWQNLGSATQQ